jgi:hypothetical protein
MLYAQCRLRETAGVNGKPKTVNSVYLGSVANIMRMATTGNSPITKIQSRSFGSLRVADQIEKAFGLAAIVDSFFKIDSNDGPSIGEYFLYAVLNRMKTGNRSRAAASVGAGCCWKAATCAKSAAVKAQRSGECAVDTDLPQSVPKIALDNKKNTLHKRRRRAAENGPRGTKAVLFAGAVPGGRRTVRRPPRTTMWKGRPAGEFSGGGPRQKNAAAFPRCFHITGSKKECAPNLYAISVGGTDI